MIFAKGTGYAIRALAYMANQPEGHLCNLQEMAEHEQIPAFYLRKVLGELRRHGLLASAKGLHGGYKLARPPQAITLWEVFCALEPNSWLERGAFGRGDCHPEKACPMHMEWQEISKILIQWLQSKTIFQIAITASRGVWLD